MNLLKSSPFLIILGYSLSTSILLTASEMLKLEASVATQVTEPSLEEAEKWLFSYFDVPEMQNLPKPLQHVVTSYLADMVIGTFVMERPLRSYYYRYSSAIRNDSSVSTVVLSHNQHNEAPTHLCFCTPRRCRIANLALSEADASAVSIVMTSPEGQFFTKVIFSNDNNKVLLMTSFVDSHGIVKKNKGSCLYELSLDNFQVTAVREISRPPAGNKAQEPAGWHDILDTAYLDNGNLVIATGKKEICMFDPNGACIANWIQDRFDKESIAFMARIHSPSSSVISYIEYPATSLNRSFRLLRFNLDSGNSQQILEVPANKCYLCRYLALTGNGAIIVINNWQRRYGEKRNNILLIDAQNGNILSALWARFSSNRYEISPNGRFILFTPSTDGYNNEPSPFTSLKPLIVHTPSKRPLIVLNRETEDTLEAVAQFNSDCTHVITTRNTENRDHFDIAFWKLNPFIQELDASNFLEQMPLKDALVILLARTYKAITRKKKPGTQIQAHEIKRYLMPLFKSLDPLVKRYIINLLA